MEEDVDEAGALVKWMRRWLCVQLCCCCIVPDPETAKGRKPRQERMRMRRAAADADRMDIAEKHMSKAAEVDSMIRQHDPAYNGDEAGQRNELFKTADAIKKERRATSSGFGVFPGVQGGWGYQSCARRVLARQRVDVFASACPRVACAPCSGSPRPALALLQTHPRAAQAPTGRSWMLRLRSRTSTWTRLGMPWRA